MKLTKFGFWLYNAIRENKMTVQNLAYSLGVSKRTVQRWLHTEILPKRKNMNQIKNFFGMDVNYENINPDKVIDDIVDIWINTDAPDWVKQKVKAELHRQYINI